MILAWAVFPPYEIVIDLKQFGPGYPPPYWAVFNATMKSLSTL
jgi:hypothetical protein